MTAFLPLLGFYLCIAVWMTDGTLWWFCVIHAIGQTGTAKLTGTLSHSLHGFNDVFLVWWILPVNLVACFSCRIEQSFFFWYFADIWKGLGEMVLNRMCWEGEWGGGGLRLAWKDGFKPVCVCVCADHLFKKFIRLCFQKFVSCKHWQWLQCCADSKKNV